MHLRPVKYTASAGREAGLASRQPSMRLPATLLDGGGNNNNSNPLFTVKQYSSLQQSSGNTGLLGSQANMAQIKSSREISAIRSLPIEHFNNTNYNNNSSSRGGFSSAFLAANGATNETNFQDKMKLMEISIINLVELSCLAAEEGNRELALIKSKEALDGLASLRSLVLQRQSPGGDFADRQPVTRGVRFVELALMVNCNLAAQLMNSDHLEQSLELYTQITKLAGSSGSANQSSNLLLIGGQQLYGDSKFLLYRFGMNIGNVLYRMKDYQRALKYYRLTLDRLSSSSQTSLRIKLMNNISLALLALKQENEAITSMNLLLDENLSYGTQLINDNRSQTKREQANEGNGSIGGPCNSNHQRFALNLIVCYYQRHDSASIMATLKALIKADICHHYERVLDGSRLARHRRQQGSNGEQMFRYDNGAQMASDPLNETSSAGFAQADRAGLHLLARTTSPASQSKSHNFQLFGASASNPIGGNRRESLDGRALIDSGARQTAIQSFSRAAGHENRHEPAAAASRALMKPSNVEKFGQVMSRIQGDRLETLIGEREKQIVRFIMLACKLLLDLDRSNESIKIKFSDQPAKGSSSRSNQQWTDNRLATSAFDFCLNLLSASPRYKSLVADLKVDRMNGLLGKRYKLDEAVALFREIGTHDLADHDRNQWRAVSEQQRAVSGGGQPMPTTDRLRGKSDHLLTSEIKYNASETKASQRRPLRSSATAINKALVHLLQKHYAKALEEADGSPVLDGADLARALVNHANCLFNLNRLAEADSFYQRAIKIEPNCWEAHYNLVIISRRLDRSYEQLNSSTKSHLARDRQIPISSLLNRSMILSTIQSALM